MRHLGINVRSRKLLLPINRTLESIKPEVENIDYYVEPQITILSWINSLSGVIDPPKKIASFNWDK